MAYNVSNAYKEMIYSQFDENNIRVIFNGTELEDAGYYCDELTITSRILANDGNNIFSLDNFVSREAEISFYSLPDTSIIATPVEIQIGTLIDNSYEYVPMGVFNIQEEPTTDGNKTTLKLRDNRVKFDFNYDGSTLIEQNGGSVTKRQILEDICTQAGVTNVIGSFEFEDDNIGSYDNTVKATQYISYLAEQSGNVAVINRSGQLDFIDLTDTNTITTWQIPLSILGDYELGKPYEVERVVFESGIIKFESSNDETLETLYINANNPYINEQEQVDFIYNRFNGFSLDSVKINTVLGNPAIDAYDFIEVIDDEDNDTPLFKTLANNIYKYNGVHRHQFTTEISESKREENVTLTGEEVFQRYAKAEIDNVNNTITETVADLQDNYATKTELQQTSDSLTFSIQTAQSTAENNSTMINAMKSSFTTAGLLITSDLSEFQSLFNDKGVHIYNQDTLIAIFSPKGTGVKKLIVEESIQLQNLKLSKTTKDTQRHGIIDVIVVDWLENLIESIEELEVD